MIWDILAYVFIGTVIGVAIMPTENQLKHAFRRRQAAKRAAEEALRG